MSIIKNKKNTECIFNLTGYVNIKSFFYNYFKKFTNTTKLNNKIIICEEFLINNFIIFPLKLTCLKIYKSHCKIKLKKMKIKSKLKIIEFMSDNKNIFNNILQQISIYKTIKEYKNVIFNIFYPNTVEKIDYRKQCCSHIKMKYVTYLSSSLNSITFDNKKINDYSLYDTIFLHNKYLNLQNITQSMDNIYFYNKIGDKLPLKILENF